MDIESDARPLSMLRASNSKRRNLSSNASISVSSVISSGRGGRCIPVNKSSVDLLNGAGPTGSFGRAAKPRTPESEMNGWRRFESFNTTTPFQAHENLFGFILAHAMVCAISEHTRLPYCRAMRRVS